jgi:hypothetical protein
VLIPIGIISAILVRPVFPKDKLLQPVAAEVLPVVLKSLDKENYTVNIRSNSDNSQLQLEWINKNALKYPTATIYEDMTNTDNISKAVLIGRIEATGNYHFQLIKKADKNYHFILFDFIHQQIIDSIRL